MPTPSHAEELLPTTTGRYSLRGKKLPPSIFGDSGSEEEEEDDDDYHPPSMKFVRLRALKTEDEAEGQPCDDNSAALDPESEQRAMLGEGGSERCKGGDQTGRLEVDNLNGAESDLSTGTALLEPSKSANEDGTDTTPLPQPSHKRKRGRPCRSGGDNNSGGATRREHSAKKKRIKIDVTGLPSFTRRKRNKERKATCKYCRRKFCDFTGVTMHVKKFHSTADDLGGYLQDLKRLSVTKCSICHKEFENRFQLQLHEDKTHFKVWSQPWLFWWFFSAFLHRRGSICDRF